MLDRDPFQVAVRGDECFCSRGVGEARMVPEDQQRRGREPPIGCLRPRVAEQAGHEGQWRLVGTGLLACPPAVPLVFPRDPRRISEGLPQEPADHPSPGENGVQQSADPRQAQETMDDPGGSARAPLEAPESCRTDEDDAAETVRFRCRGDDDVLSRQRERDDVDRGLSGLQGGVADAPQVVAVERPAIGRVGPIRCAESEPVDQDDSPVFGQPDSQRSELDPGPGGVEAVQKQDGPTLAELVAADAAGGVLISNGTPATGGGRGIVTRVSGGLRSGRRASADLGPSHSPRVRAPCARPRRHVRRPGAGPTVAPDVRRPRGVRPLDDARRRPH